MKEEPRCNSDECLVKCRFCGKILSPPMRCDGCGQDSFDLVPFGRLEWYVQEHVGKSVLIPLFSWNGTWVVERFIESGNLMFLPRDAVVSYVSYKKPSKDILEWAVDTIQSLRFVDVLWRDKASEILQSFEEAYKKDSKKFNRFYYSVTKPVRLSLNNVASEMGVSLLRLLSAFVMFRQEEVGE